MLTLQDIKNLITHCGHYASPPGVADDEVSYMSNRLAMDGLARTLFDHFSVEPFNVILYCPACGVQHIDAPEPVIGWMNPPHRTHLCGKCGHKWRPSDVCTYGVASIETHGEEGAQPAIARIKGPQEIVARIVLGHDDLVAAMQAAIEKSMPTIRDEWSKVPDNECVPREVSRLDFEKRFIKRWPNASFTRHEVDGSYYAELNVQTAWEMYRELNTVSTPNPFPDLKNHTLYYAGYRIASLITENGKIDGITLRARIDHTVDDRLTADEHIAVGQTVSLVRYD